MLTTLNFETVTHGSLNFIEVPASILMHILRQAIGCRVVLHSQRQALAVARGDRVLDDLGGLVNVGLLPKFEQGLVDGRPHGERLSVVSLDAGLGMVELAGG